MKHLLENSAESFILLFFIVTFLQSGIDKIVDWKGNLSFINDHFKGSPLSHLAFPLLGLIMIMEIVASFTMTYGLYEMISNQGTFFALVGMQLTSLTLVCLQVGQRLAKDYPGAMCITIYFILSILGIFILTHS